MKIPFYKYQGAGNDFIIIDQRTHNYHLTTAQINHLCDRKFGIGADGLMLLELANQYDYKMLYFNADGNESTMCGNGGRCIAQFALDQNIANKTQKFIAVDGIHQANLLDIGIVNLQMIDIHQISWNNGNQIILNTGSPHYVQFTDNELSSLDVYHEGKKIRNSIPFKEAGINVNFVSRLDNGLSIRTYERGVEDETLACGTGVTAAAIASTYQKNGKFEIPVKTLGGNLKVTFNKVSDQLITDIWLEGPATFVFLGTITL